MKTSYAESKAGAPRPDGEPRAMNMPEPAFHKVGIGIVAATPLGLVITENFSE